MNAVRLARLIVFGVRTNCPECDNPRELDTMPARVCRHCWERGGVSAMTDALYNVEAHLRDSPTLPAPDGAHLWELAGELIRLCPDPDAG